MNNQQKESEELKSEINDFRKANVQMRDDEIGLQTEIVDSFRKSFSFFWEFAQSEMNEAKNEHFGLNREVTKLVNEIKGIQNQIEVADRMLKSMEKETGIRTFH